MATPTRNANCVFYDLEGGYTEEWNAQSGWIAKRRVQTSWSNVQDFPALMAGEHSRAAGTTGVIQRKIPEIHPIRTSLRVSEVRLVGTIGRPVQENNGVGPRFDFADTGGNAGQAQFELVYTRLPYEVHDDDTQGATEFMRYVEKRKTFSCESLQIPGRGFKFTSDNQQIMEPATKLFPSVQLEYIWHLVPDAPLYTTIFNAMGCVNSAAFDGYDAETVLFIAPHMEPTADCREARCWNITFQMIYKPSGWNKFLRRRTGDVPAFVTVVDVETGTVGPYSTAAFAGMFA